MVSSNEKKRRREAAAAAARIEKLAPINDYLHCPGHTLKQLFFEIARVSPSINIKLELSQIGHAFQCRPPSCDDPNVGVTLFHHVCDPAFYEMLETLNDEAELLGRLETEDHFFITVSSLASYHPANFTMAMAAIQSLKNLQGVTYISPGCGLADWLSEWAEYPSVEDIFSADSSLDERFLQALQDYPELRIS